MDVLALYRKHLPHYREIWAVDFEFHAPDGELPQPIVVVARELLSGQLIRQWLLDKAPDRPPYPIDKGALFVAYSVAAEASCHLSLAWRLPERVLDLYAEFRWLTSGLEIFPTSKFKYNLLRALEYHGLDRLSIEQKEVYRSLAIRGGPFTEQERRDLTDYCQTDVDALARLLPAMLPKIELAPALFRGRYGAEAVSRMERTGIPVDTALLARVQEHQKAIVNRLTTEVDRDFGVFEPRGMVKVDPRTAFGAAVLWAAKEHDVDPTRLAEVADDFFWEARDSQKEIVRARKAAREATGLTPYRLNRWEDDGHDHASWPDLDIKARELARLYPELGIGAGYSSDSGEDRTDYAGRLWEVLREDDMRLPRRDDPDLMRGAAEWLSSQLEMDNTPRPSTWRTHLFAAFLHRRGIPWPRLPSGALNLDKEVFKSMAQRFPELEPLRQLRKMRSQMRLQDLPVGEDGRCRTGLMPFASKTARNQPSNAKFMFGLPKAFRSLIRPAPGRALASLDWSGQEFAIAAVLSGDKNMQADYAFGDPDGDPYVAFGQRAGLLPKGATKKTHDKLRSQIKTCCGLGALYGAGARTLGLQLGIKTAAAKSLLDLHHRIYKRFWAWSDYMQDLAMIRGYIRTSLGWQMHVRSDCNPRTIRNFPMQACGSDIMRLACCLATEAGIMVCAPVHDALVIEGAIEEIDETVRQAQTIMQRAGEVVLRGFTLRTDAVVIRHPDCYVVNQRGAEMWQTILRLLAEEEERVSVTDVTHTSVTDVTHTLSRM